MPAIPRFMLLVSMLGAWPGATVTAQVLTGSDLQLTGTTPSIIYDDTDQAGLEWDIQGRNGFFAIRDLQSNQNFLGITRSRFSIALGYDSSTANPNTVAIGNKASATGEDALALGFSAAAVATRSVSIGTFASAAGHSGIAMGYGAAASGSSSAALGYLADSAGVDSTALGRSASSPGQRSAALGTSANSVGPRSIALGWFASSPGFESTALGPAADSAGNYSTAIGYKASAPNPDTIILGEIPNVNSGQNYTTVGMGTTDPLAPVHIFRDDATQEFLFLESNEIGTVQDRAMMYLVNNGGIRFEFENPVLNTAWRFQAATGNQDNFEIAKVGTGEIEFRVDADGNAYVAGLLFENSDRNTKTDIVPVDPDQVLEKVTQLPIAEWSYKESPDSRHIGPMAQDFHAAFRTGDSDRRLATMDVGGVAIASIQALAKQNGELEARNRELEAKNEALEGRLALVEAMITQLLPQTARN